MGPTLVKIMKIQSFLAKTSVNHDTLGTILHHHDVLDFTCQISTWEPRYIVFLLRGHNSRSHTKFQVARKPGRRV